MFDYFCEFIKFLFNKFINLIFSSTLTAPNVSQENPDYYKAIVLEKFKAIESYNDSLAPQVISIYNAEGFLPVNESDYLKHKDFFDGILDEFIQQYKIFKNKIENFGGGNGWIIALENFFTNEGQSIKSHIPMAEVVYLNSNDSMTRGL